MANVHKDPEAATLFLSVPSVTDFSHRNRKNRDKVACLFIALFSDSSRKKPAPKHQVQTIPNSVSASYERFTAFT